MWLIAWRLGIVNRTPTWKEISISIHLALGVEESVCQGWAVGRAPSGLKKVKRIVA